MALLPAAVRRRWIGVVLLLVVAALLELVTASAIFGMAAGSGRASALLSSLHLRGTTTVLAGIAALLLAKNALLAEAAMLQARATAESTTAVFDRIVAGLLRAPYELHLRRRSADVLQQSVFGTNLTYRVYVGAAMSVAGEALVALCLAVVVVVAAPALALLACAIVGVTVLLSLRATSSTLRDGGARLHDAERSMLSSVQEILLGIREIRTAQRERGFLARATAASSRFSTALRRELALLALPRIANEALFVVVAALLFVVLRRSALSQRDAFALLTVFAYAGFRVLASANRFSYSVRQLTHHDRAVSELVALVREVETAEVPERPAREHRRAPVIELRGVSYRYEGSDRPAVSEISATIGRGELVAFVGPNGSGKSTLLELMAGLLTPQAGAILADGTALAAWLHAAPAAVAYVPQMPFLIDDSVARNIAFIVDDGAVDALALARIQQAARTAQIEALAETAGVVGENGRSISGGQRQRVAFARALFDDAELLLLDEWSSAIDPEGEAALRRSLAALCGAKTIVLVTQDLEATRHCDRIFVMDKGRIVESGTFDELCARPGPFRRLSAG